MHNFCQSEALPDGFLVQKVSLNVLYICVLITFPYWITFMYLKCFPYCVNTEHLEAKYTERNVSLFGKAVILVFFFNMRIQKV